jgi:hypothetical protein
MMPAFMTNTEITSTGSTTSFHRVLPTNTHAATHSRANPVKSMELPAFLERTSGIAPRPDNRRKAIPWASLAQANTEMMRFEPGFLVVRVNSRANNMLAKPRKNKAVLISIMKNAQSVKGQRLHAFGHIISMFSRTNTLKQVPCHSGFLSILVAQPLSPSLAQFSMRVISRIVSNACRARV